jgi:ATP-dependent helicase/nuclease subunit A
MEISRDEVRVATVHGAKGWKRRSYSGGHHDLAAGYATAAADPPADGKGGEVMVWAVRKNEDPPAVGQARQAMLDDRG